MNFYEFIVNLESVCERMLTKDCKALAKHWVSTIIPTFELAYILDEVFSGPMAQHEPLLIP